MPDRRLQATTKEQEPSEDKGLLPQEAQRKVGDKVPPGTGAAGNRFHQEWPGPREERRGK